MVTETAEQICGCKSVFTEVSQASKQRGASQ